MQVYTILFQTSDAILELLSNSHYHRMMENDIFQSIHDTYKPTFRAALHHLVEEKLVKADPHPNYLLLGGGSTLHSSGGYKAKFEKENIAESFKDAIEQVGLKSAQSVVDTNASIQTLNTQTTSFYEKQKDYNTIQKRLTWAIVVSSIIYTGVTLCGYLWPLQRQEPQTKQSEPQTEQVLNNLKKRLQKIEDSLKIGVPDSSNKP